MYDYLLGGKDNFAADRAAAEQLLAVIPDVAAIAADKPAFLGRAVRYLTSKGVRQFVDLGSGLPTRCNVHEVAQQNAPGTRVVYVDYDPVVAVHGRALLASGGDVAVLHADLTEPSSILEHPGLLRVLDLSRPVGLICASSLHFVADEADPWGIVARYRDRLCSGSYLAMTHAPSRVPGEDPEQTRATRRRSSVRRPRRCTCGRWRRSSGSSTASSWSHPASCSCRTGAPTRRLTRLAGFRSFRAGVGRKP
jgi:hypothetical protein